MVLCSNFLRRMKNGAHFISALPNGGANEKRACRLRVCINAKWTFMVFILLQVVQEYERSVIFRLGRLRKGGAKVSRQSW